MIRHIVMWKLHPEADGRDRTANILHIKGLLEGLVTLIPEIRSLEVGINVLPDAANSDLVLACEFDDLAALDRYARHPEHLKVAAQIAPLRSSRSAIDHEF